MVGFCLHEILRLIKFIETESRTEVITRGWGKAEWEVIV